MPLWPGTGIPYGRSPFAFSTGTAEARMIVGVFFSSWTAFVTCSSGVGDASAGLMFREPACRGTRFDFFSAGLGVGRGWKVFETDCPTFLKKSPTGSAFTHGTHRKKSMPTGNKTQREQIKDLMRSSAFNVKPRFSARMETYGKQKISFHGIFAAFLKTDNAIERTAADR